MLIDMYVMKVGQRKPLESTTLILGPGLAQTVSTPRRSLWEFPSSNLKSWLDFFSLRVYLGSFRNTRKTSTDGESGGGGGGMG